MLGIVESDFTYASSVTTIMSFNVQVLQVFEGFFVGGRGEKFYGSDSTFCAAALQSYMMHKRAH